MENTMNSGQASGTPKIDVHVHYLPQAYTDALLEYVPGNPDGFPTPPWDPETHLEVMERLNISTSMVTVSSPHINFGDASVTKRLAREVNEYGAALKNKYPAKFGLIASLPLPNVENSIEEIRYALDVLNADGFALPTNTKGIYLGDPCLDAVLEELDRQKAVVILHPNKPAGIPENVAEEAPIPMMEFFFDTTRTVTNMLLKGTFRNFPDIKFVIPHAGAFLPILADRMAMFFQSLYKQKIDVYSELKCLYYDVAGACLPRQLAALIDLVGTDHLLYGSDYPYTPEFGCAVLANALDNTALISDEVRQAIYYDNALKLFPRFPF